MLFRSSQPTWPLHRATRRSSTSPLRSASGQSRQHVDDGQTCTSCAAQGVSTLSALHRLLQDRPLRLILQSLPRDRSFPVVLRDAPLDPSSPLPCSAHDRRFVRVPGDVANRRRVGSSSGGCAAQVDARRVVVFPGFGVDEWVGLASIEGLDDTAVEGPDLNREE